MLNKKLFLTAIVSLGLSFSINAFAANLYFDPSNANFNIGNIFKVSVLVDSADESINSSETTINFPSDLLEVVSISKFDSVFSIWAEEPSFSNASGTISFVGGLPTPGFTGIGGKILDIVFKSKKAGNASLSFSTSSVYANDGLGTNVLENSYDANFALGDQIQNIATAFAF